MGIAMISGISAMMQVGNNVNNLSLLSKFKEDKYHLSKKLPDNDKLIMALLLNYSGSDSDVCSSIIDSFNTTTYIPGEPTPSGYFVPSCTLSNNELQHRVIIKKNELGSFKLFSCHVKTTGSYCPFEDI